MLNNEKSMTEWKNPPTLEQLKADMENVVAHNSQNITNIDGWLDLLYVRGAAKRKKVKGRSNIQPKLIRKQLEWRVPSLTAPFLSTPDLFNVTGRTYEDVYAAQQNQILLNYQFNTFMDKVPFIDKCVRTFASEGTLFLRIGWEFEERVQEVSEPDYDYVEPTMEEVAILREALMLKQTDIGKYKALVPENVKHSVDVSLEMNGAIYAIRKPKDIVTKKTVTVKNNPVWEVVDYRRLYPDPNCRDNIENAQFVVYEFETTIDELTRDGNYKNLDKVKRDIPMETLTDAQIQDGITFNYSDNTRKKLTAYEYWGNWDIHGNGTVEPVLITWIGNVIIRMEENPFPDKKHPFISAAYTPVKNSIYGEPDAALLKDNQEVVGATMRSMIDIIARTANGQKGMRQDMLDEVNKIRYQRGDDFEFNGNVDARQGMITLTAPEVPQSAQYMLQLQNNEAESLSGIKAYNSGIGSEALGDVAAGIRGALDATSKRDLTILNRLAHCFEKAARKTISLNAEFLDEEEVVRVTEDKYVEVRRDDLAGNIDIKLSISTAEEDNNKANQMAFMLQTLGNTVPFELTQLVFSNIADLRNMPDLAKKLRDYQPQPDPIAQEKAKLELEEVRANILAKQAQAEYYRSQTGLNFAKANNTEADTNKKSLDFIEQESGVTQERAKELHQAQAEGNMKLELIKAAASKAANNPSERVRPQDTGE